MDRGDLYAIRQIHGARLGDPEYLASADANLDGRISAFDVLMARRNEAYGRGATPSDVSSLGGTADRIAAVVPQAGFDATAPMSFFETATGWSQGLSLSDTGHQAVFDASQDPETVFDWIYRDTPAESSLYVYRVDDAYGSLNGTMPLGTLSGADAAAYREAAIGGAVSIFTSDQREDDTTGRLFELADIPADWEYYSLFARQGAGERTRDWFPFASVNEDGYPHFEAVTAADLAGEQVPPWRDHLQVDESGAPTAVAPLRVESLSAGEADPDFGELVYQLTRGWTDVEMGDVTAVHVPTLAMVGRPVEMSVDVADPEGVVLEVGFGVQNTATGESWQLYGMQETWSTTWDPATPGEYTVSIAVMTGWGPQPAPVTRSLRVTEDTAIVDNDDSGYSKTGAAWTLARDDDATTEAYADFYHRVGASADDAAQWQFDAIEPGVYGVYTTHVPSAEHGSAHFSIYDGDVSGGALELSRSVDQSVPAGDFNCDGQAWVRLGYVHIDQSDTLTVRMTAEEGTALADAVCIQQTGFQFKPPKMAMHSQAFELVGGMITDASIGRMEFYLDNGDGVLTRPADEGSDGTASVAATGGPAADELLYTAYNGESASYTLHAGQLPEAEEVTLIAASYDPQGNFSSDTPEKLMLTRHKLMVGAGDETYRESFGHWDWIGDGYRVTYTEGAWVQYRFDNLPRGSYNIFESHRLNRVDLASIRVYDGDPGGRETQPLTFQTEASEMVLQEDGLAVEFDERVYWDIGTVYVGTGTLVVEVTANCCVDSSFMYVCHDHETPSEPEVCDPCKEGEIPGIPADEGACQASYPGHPNNDSGNTIMYADGGAVLSVDDLAGSGGCATGGCAGGGSLVGGHKRMFSNQFDGRQDYGNGYGWEVQTWPYLRENDAQNEHYVLSNGISGSFFGKESGEFVSGHGSYYTYDHQDGASDADDLFLITDPEGSVFEFYDFTQTTYPQGALKRVLTAGNHVIEVESFNNDGQITEIRESFTEGSTTTINAWAYTYLSSGDNDGRLESVTLRRKEFTDPDEEGDVDWSYHRKVTYDYYELNEDHGGVGDLKTATLQYEYDDGQSQWTDDGEIHYYRYYEANEQDGYEHGLQYALLPEAYEKAEDYADSQSTTVENLTDTQLANYACYNFEYNAYQRITREQRFGGTEDYSYSYTVIVDDPSHGGGFNDWATKTVETLPDSVTKTVYTNIAGQVMLEDIADGSDHWISYYLYDEDDGHLLRHYEPSAIASYSESGLDDLSITYANSGDDGLVYVYEYGDATSGTEVEGYLQYEYVSEGHNDISSNKVKLRKYEYTSHTADDTGETIYPISKIIDYKTDQDTIETQFSYTYHEYDDGGQTKERNQVLQKTTTLPSISSAQNGSGSSATRIERFDEYGNLVWVEDERGFLTHYEYDVDSRARVRMIQDVDVDEVSDEPSGWSTPSGGGEHLITDYTVDDLGRVTQTLGPIHDVDGTDTRTASWTVYDEDGEETRRAVGFAVETTPASGTFDDYTIVGPVSVTQYDHDGRVLDQFQAEPDTTEPATPLTSIAGESVLAGRVHQLDGEPVHQDAADGHGQLLRYPHRDVRWGQRRVHRHRGDALRCDELRLRQLGTPRLERDARGHHHAHVFRIARPGQ